MTSYGPMKKNANQRIVYPILDADGDPVTGATGADTEYSLDGADFVNCSDEVHEIGTASGVYYIDLLAAETNADVVAIQTKITNVGAKTTVLVFYTQSTNLDAMTILINSIFADTTTLRKIGTNKWAIIGTQLIIYDDNKIDVLYTFDLDSATAPTSRTPV